MRIYIRKSDIQRGVKCSATCCPIARAVSRKLGAEFVMVTDDKVTVYQDWDRPPKVYKPNKAASEFIKRFDGHKKVKPCHISIKEA